MQLPAEGFVDVHVHIQPWEQLKPEVRAKMIQGRPDLELISTFQGDPNAFAIEIDLQDFAPIYRRGDLLLVSPLAEPSERARVLIRLSSGELQLQEVLRHNLQLLEVQSLQRIGPITGIRRSAIAWTARVLWTSQ